MKIIDKRGETQIEGKTFKEYRSKVLDYWLNFENEIDGAIMGYYDIMKAHKFRIDFLDDASMSMGVKMNVIEKIIKRNNKKLSKEQNQALQLMRQLNNVRNIFAHNRPGAFGNYDSDGNLILEPKTDPKKPGEYLDFNQHYEKFQSNYYQMRKIILKSVNPDSFVMP